MESYCVILLVMRMFVTIKKITMVTVIFIIGKGFPDICILKSCIEILRLIHNSLGKTHYVTKKGNHSDN